MDSGSKIMPLNFWARSPDYWVKQPLRTGNATQRMFFYYLDDVNKTRRRGLMCLLINHLGLLSPSRKSGSFTQWEYPCLSVCSFMRFVTKYHINCLIFDMKAVEICRTETLLNTALCVDLFTELWTGTELKFWR